MSDDYERVKKWCADPRSMPCAPYNSICRVFEDYDRLRATLNTAEALAECALLATPAPVAVESEGSITELRVAVVDAYRAGKWTCQQLSAEEQDAIWKRLRDLCGIEPGTETARAAMLSASQAQDVK